ncbi:MAG: tetratricopeptide repeat protein [Bacteroidetes bacterium]|nr:tetratricopeptide repeat protein [Bacteroidota bacterium]
MKAFFNILLFLIITFTSLANKDSLLLITKEAKASDLQKMNALYELSWEFIYTNVDSSYLFAKQAYVLSKKKEFLYFRPKILNLLGSIFQIKGEYLKAIEYYQQTVNFGLKNKDDETLLKAYSNIGALYINIHDSNKALDYLTKGLDIAKKLNKQSSFSSIYNNVGLVYMNKFQYDKALEYFKQSLKIYENINDENGIGSSFANIGNAYQQLKKNNDALLYYKKSLIIAEEQGNLYEVSKINYDIGDILNSLKQYASAINHLNKAKTVAEEIEEHETLMNSVEELSSSYKGLKNYKKAFEFLEKFYLLKKKSDSIFKKDEVHKKEIEFEFNNKSYRDSLTNAELNKTKDAQIKANKAQIEKDKLFKISLSIGFILVIIFAAAILNRFNLIKKQKRIIEIKNEETERQKKEIEDKNKEILDSIKYAKHIQSSILPSHKYISRVLKKSK